MIIFVFGSNLIGRHGAGAALTAMKKYGAELSVGEGRTGQAYAIPTKNKSLQTRTLTDIHESISKFILYTREHPELNFLVTRIGCGLAGYTDNQIAPLFITAPDNCFFSKAWCKYL